MTIQPSNSVAVNNLSMASPTGFEPNQGSFSNQLMAPHAPPVHHRAASGDDADRPISKIGSAMRTLLALTVVLVLLAPRSGTAQADGLLYQ